MKCISLNEQPLLVRRNLWRFLKEATRLLVEASNLEGDEQELCVIQAPLKSL